MPSRSPRVIIVPSNVLVPAAENQDCLFLPCARAPALMAGRVLAAWGSSSFCSDPAVGGFDVSAPRSSTYLAPKQYPTAYMPPPDASASANSSRTPARTLFSMGITCIELNFRSSSTEKAAHLLRSLSRQPHVAHERLDPLGSLLLHLINDGRRFGVTCGRAGAVRSRVAPEPSVTVS